jgi:hypothetical protein
VNVNPSETKKNKIEGVSHAVPVLDSRHACRPIQVGGVRDLS